MNAKQQIPFGFWPSSVSPAMQAAQVRLQDVSFDSDGSLVWLEALSGKTTLLVKKGKDAPRDISGGLKVDPGVGYGGGDFGTGSGTVVFPSQNRLFKVSLESGLPQAVTPEFGGSASPKISPDGKQVLFIHTYEKTDCLAIVSIDGNSWPQKIASGADFYMQPAWHPDGKRIAWIEWDHPQMPWDGTRLMTGSLTSSGLIDQKQIFGSKDIPVFQPEYSPDGCSLAFLANDGEWDSLFVLNLESGKLRAMVENAALIDPAWVQGIKLYGWSADSSGIFYLQNIRGTRTLHSLEIKSGQSRQIDIAPYTWVSQITVSPVSNKFAIIASSPKIPARLITLDGSIQTIERRSTSESIHPSELPEPEPIEWQAEDGSVVHGLFYPPCSNNFESEGLPPAIVNIHGGPTSARINSYNGEAAYFCTRGYAFLEVNYRGSTGYGRSYMLKLRKHWGQIDTEDAAGGAAAMGALGLADPKRMIIMGGSSGGYTVLNALIHFPGVFKAGVNFFGVANLFDLVIGTHKFEEHYNDSLVGTLPESADLYKAWSPIFHADQIKDPVAVFQGAEDKVVPPQHSEQLVAVLKANHVPHIYRLYPGEGHGFRLIENIIDQYKNLESFLQQYVIF